MHEMIVGFSKSTKKFAPFSKAIQVWDGVEYSHVYFQFRSEKYDVDMIYQASSTMLNYMSKEVFLNHNEIIHEVRINLTEDQYFHLMQNCMKSSGLQYGVLQVFGIVFADIFKLNYNIFADPEKYVCSEWVAEQLELCGYKFNKALDLVKPSDVLKVIHENKS